MSSVMNGKEPYRATRMWLEAVYLFRHGVQTGKRRKNLRTYDNCFIAQEAITWFLEVLKENFDPNIKREQAHKLLQKFYKTGIFTSVTNVRNSTVTDGCPFVSPINNEADFKDNSNLYRLVETDRFDVSGTLKNKFHRLNSGLLPSGCKSKIRSEVKLNTGMSPSKESKLWKQAFMKRLVEVVGVEITTLVPEHEGSVNGVAIKTNAYYSNHGKENLISHFRNEIPEWLISAMKCLALWPNYKHRDLGPLEHVNYPGFDNDVFRLIRDYYASSKMVPLLTGELYDVFITAFIKAELLDFNSRLYSQKINSSMAGSCTPKNKGYIQELYPLNASESVECLINDILTPSSRWRNDGDFKYRLKPTIKPKKLNMRSDNKPKNLVQRSMTTGQINAINSKLKIKPLVPKRESIDDGKNATLPLPMTPKDYSLERYTKPFYLETAFTGVQSPITRVVSHTELKSTLPRAARSLSTDFGILKEPAQTDPRNSVSPGAVSSPGRFAYENPVLELSASDMINHPKFSNILKTGGIQDSKNGLTSLSFCDYESSKENGEKKLNENNSPTNSSGIGSLTSEYSEDHEFLNRLRLKSASAINLSDNNKDRSPYNPVSKLKYRLKDHGVADGTTTPKRKNMNDLKSRLSYYANSPCKTARRTLAFYYGADACIPGLITQEGKQLAICAFRLLTLLMPPSRRAHLQMLLRCMSRVSANEKLMLDVGVSNRAKMINTFFRHILCPNDEEDFDELLSLRIVTFMMDNDAAIFSLDGETDLVNEVEKLLEKEKTPMMQATPKCRSLSPAILKRSSTPALVKYKSQEVCVKSNFEDKENSNLEDSSEKFCHSLSLDEYEEQSFACTSKSLRSLIDAIVEDKSTETKDKIKRIKKFRDTYPNIYREKFGPEGCELLKTETKRRPFANIWRKV